MYPSLSGRTYPTLIYLLSTDETFHGPWYDDPNSLSLTSPPVTDGQPRDLFVDF